MELIKKIQNKTFDYFFSKENKKWYLSIIYKLILQLSDFYSIIKTYLVMYRPLEPMVKKRKKELWTSTKCFNEPVDIVDGELKCIGFTCQNKDDWDFDLICDYCVFYNFDKRWCLYHRRTKEPYYSCIFGLCKICDKKEIGRLRGK